jgi:hypothetical protein
VTEPSGTFVDPRVSRAKFEREVAVYRAREEEHQRRGWWLLKTEFPEVFVVFGAPQMKPATVVFGALLDFRNYDVWSPSVTLADPFTRIPYKASELPHNFAKRTVRPAAAGATETAPAVEEVQALMQAWAPDEVPFFCLPGVREYHHNPGHSGDPWLMHRRRGEGTLFFILEKLHRYGIAPLRAINWQIQVAQAGYMVAEIPS